MFFPKKRTNSNLQLALRTSFLQRDVNGSEIVSLAKQLQENGFRKFWQGITGEKKCLQSLKGI